MNITIINPPDNPVPNRDPFLPLQNDLVSLVLEYLSGRDLIRFSLFNNGEYKPVVETYRIKQLRLIPAWLTSLNVADTVIQTLAGQPSEQVQNEVIIQLRDHNPLSLVGMPPILGPLAELIEIEKRPRPRLTNIYRALFEGNILFAARLFNRLEIERDEEAPMRMVMSSLVIMEGFDKVLEFIEHIEDEDNKSKFQSILVESYMAQNELEKALDIAKTMVDGEHKRDAYLSIIKRFIDQNQLNRALEVMKDMPSQHARVFYYLMEAYIKVGNVQAAIEMKNQIESSPADHLTKRSLKFSTVICFIDLGRIDEVFPILIELSGGKKFKRLIDYLVQRGDLEHALKAYDTVTEVEMKIHILNSVATYLIDQGREEEALSVCSRDGNRYKNSMDPSFLAMVKIALKQKNPDKALSIINNQIQSSDNKIEALSDVIEFYLHEGNPERALSIARHSQGRGKRDPLFVKIICYYVMQGQSAQALNLMNNVVTRTSRNEVFSLMISFFIGQGKLTEAWDLVNRIENNDNKQAILREIAYFYIGQNNSVEALKVINQLSDLNAIAWLLLKLAKHYLKEGRLREAELILPQLSSYEHAALSSDLGQFYLKQNKIQEAERMTLIIKDNRAGHSWGFFPVGMDLIKVFLHKGEIERALQFANTIGHEDALLECLSYLVRHDPERALELANQSPGREVIFAKLALFDQNDLKKALGLLFNSYHAGTLAEDLLNDNRLDQVLIMANLLQEERCKIRLFVELANYHCSRGEVDQALIALGNCSEYDRYCFGTMDEMTEKVAQVCIEQGKIDKALEIVRQMHVEAYKVKILIKIAEHILRQGDRDRVMVIAKEFDNNDLLMDIFKLLVNERCYELALTLLNRIKPDLNDFTIFHQVGRLRAHFPPSVTPEREPQVQQLIPLQTAPVVEKKRFLFRIMEKGRLLVYRIFMVALSILRTIRDWYAIRIASNSHIHYLLVMKFKILRRRLLYHTRFI